jgi:pantetheine-phosphate adenylyltransferase
VKAKAIFAGSFDPPTLGHLEVIQSSAPLFEKLYIVVANNIAKNSLLTVEKRVELFREILKAQNLSNCEVMSTDGLVADLGLSLGASYFVRGLRGTSDLEKEFPMSVANQILSKGSKTIFIPSTKEHSFVSSSLVREIYTLGGDISSFVPPVVLNSLSKKG